MHTPEKLAALRELRYLLDAQIISDHEFNREKERILNSPSLLDLIESFGSKSAKLLSQIAWPIVALIILYSLRQPVVSKLLEAQQVSVGSFSFTVREKAQMEGNPELADALSGLSERAIELLMDTGDKAMQLVARTAPEHPSPTYIGLWYMPYAELDAKDLLFGTEPFPAFMKWALSLPGETAVDYIDAIGQPSKTRPIGPYQVREQHRFKVEQLSEQDKKRLLAAAFTLNEKGRKVWRLLARVVSEQVGAHPSGSKGPELAAPSVGAKQSPPKP